MSKISAKLAKVLVIPDDKHDGYPFKIEVIVDYGDKVIGRCDFRNGQLLELNAGKPDLQIGDVLSYKEPGAPPELIRVGKPSKKQATTSSPTTQPSRMGSTQTPRNC